MPAPLSDLPTLLRALRPVLHPGVYVFCAMPLDRPPDGLPVVAAVREPEGWAVVVPEPAAAGHGLTPLFRAEWVTLTVHSDLQAVGLTAAVAGALAAAGVACNVVAGARHDHLFVPAGRGAEAVAVLEGFQAG